MSSSTSIFILWFLIWLLLCFPNQFLFCSHTIFASYDATIGKEKFYTVILSNIFSYYFGLRKKLKPPSKMLKKATLKSKNPINKNYRPFSQCHSKLCTLFAEMSVFWSSIAMVIGPTPPGTGVTAEATFMASS